MKTPLTHHSRRDGSPASSSRKIFTLSTTALFGVVAAAQASTDYAPAHWVPVCCGQYYTSGYGHRFYVEHDMEGYYQTTISYFVNTFNDSVLFCVNGKSDYAGDAAPGDITQMIRDAYYGWTVLCW